jgi:hypothetical protein
VNETEKTAAYETLGLKPGASEAEVKAAYKKLLAFWADEGGLSAPLKKIAADMRAKIEQAHTVLTSTTTGTSSGSTTSGGTAPGPQGAGSGKGKNDPWAWVFGILLVVAGLFWYDEVKTEHDKNERNQREKQQEKPIETKPIETKPVPSAPPDYVIPYLHNGVKERVVKWTTEDLTTPGSTRIGVLGYDNQDRLVNYLQFYSQESSSSWSFYDQYVVKVSDDGLQVGVQHFQPTWQSGSIVFKDQRNVSEVGDVLVQSTVYYYHLKGNRYLLDSVVVSTPFTENKDGLQIKRSSDDQILEVLRQPNGNVINMEANRSSLPHMFDLWRFFGQTH